MLGVYVYNIIHQKAFPSTTPAFLCPSCHSACICGHICLHAYVAISACIRGRLFVTTSACMRGRLCVATSACIRGRLCVTTSACICGRLCVATCACMIRGLLCVATARCSAMCPPTCLPCHEWPSFLCAQVPPGARPDQQPLCDLL